MQKKIILLLILMFFSIPVAIAGENYTLKAGVSMIDSVPKAFYGTWRVTSKLVSTNSEALFKPSSVDLWNLSKAGDVITLENPFSGAKASIILDSVENKVIKFKKIGDYDSKKLLDIVQLSLGKDSFLGENILKLDTISDVDGHVIKTERATYKITGEKISGASIK